MTDHPADPPHCGACPHLDLNDSRCGHRFTLSRMEQAFSVCLDRYQTCPTFHRINNEQQHPTIEIAPLGRLVPMTGRVACMTIHASSLPFHQARVALRPTGT